MLGNYLTFDFGESYFRSISVVDLVLEKMPVSITLGLWSTLLAYLISIPLGIRKAVRDGTPLRHRDERRDHRRLRDPVASSSRSCCSCSSPAARYWRIFPLRGLTSDNWAELSLWGKVLDYLWHITLPVIASTIGAFATMTLLTKNSFLDEIKQAVRDDRPRQGPDRGPRPLRPRLPQRHADRDRRLPGGVHRGLLRRLADHRDDLLARRPRPARLRERDPARLPGGLRHALRLRPARPVVGLLSDLTYVWVDPRIDFESRET